MSRLSATGASLLFSTFFGGMYSDAIDAIALDAQGAVTIAGSTGSPNLPTTPGAFDTTHNGGFDVFVARVSPTSASLVYSTFLGGTVNDGVEDLALDAQGAATVTGWTRSADFPTTIGAFDTTFNGGIADAFVTQISPTGSSAVFSTFLGGTLDETAKTLALDTQGAVTVAGYTTSADFPTTPGAFDTTYSAGNNDGFVTRLSPTGASLVWSTFLGGTGGDDVYALALDPTGGTIVAGITISSDFPTTAGCFDPTWNGGAGDGFMAHLSPKGSDLRYSTYLGGTSEDYVRGLTLDALGTVTVAGVTNSPDFPTTPGAFDTTYANGTFAPYDAFITRLDLLPTGVTAFGRSSPGCTGPLAISVTSMPRVGNAGFALTCGNAPPNTSGLLALTGGRFATPVVVLGAEIWVDPTLVFLQIPATGNSIGASEVSLPIPNGRWLRGTRRFAQFFWAGPTSPPPCPPQGLSASHGLEFTVQP